jgi:hypothetical protein
MRALFPQSARNELIGLEDSWGNLSLRPGFRIGAGRFDVDKAAVAQAGEFMQKLIGLVEEPSWQLHVIS